jgi:molecular chaperone DnaK
VGIAVGIDLGTSNSVVATVLDGQAVVLADAEGRSVHPSVVAFGYGHSVVVGHRARQQLAYAPENTVFSAKRLIGRRFQSEEVQRLRKHVSWGIAEGPRGDARVRVQGRMYSVQEISAHVLAHMKAIAEAATGQAVDGAVITVPAYFNDAQRQATRDAATIAGLDCLRIINEPTAAALAYGYGQSRRQHLAVYDLGGGTFDISVLRLEGDLFEVVSTAGDTFLGGDDFDAVICDHLIEIFRKQTGADIRENPAARAKVLDAAERAKRALSQVNAVAVKVPGLVRGDDGNALGLNTPLDQGTVQRLVMPLMQRTFAVVDEALAQAGMAVSQIDHVLLVGGMTRFPLVREAVGHYFGKTPIDHLNPDQVVAQGAAIQAWSLTQFAPSSGAPDAVLLDVTPQTLGIRTIGGFVEPLIPRNTTIPTEASKVFHTAHDHQTEVRVVVCQGEGRNIAENELLGEFVLSGLRPAPRGEVKVTISFAIDADGIVRVVARDEETGHAVDLLIEASSNLSRAEVEQMRFDDVGF